MAKRHGRLVGIYVTRDEDELAHLPGNAEVAHLLIDTGLKSGALTRVKVSRREAYRLIRDAAHALEKHDA